MGEIGQAAATAAGLIARADPDLAEIVGRSLTVSVTAVAAASALGLPAGALLATRAFRGRAAVVAVLNALMGLPPVVVGLLVYLALSRSGPLGTLGLLFTPAAMIVAQTVLILPIVASLSYQVAAELWGEYRDQLRSLGAGPWRSVATLLWDGRFGLATAVLAGFGRATAEVGAVMIVGGNIDHATRVMTTAIALETSKGDLALALALGLILIALSMTISVAITVVNAATRRAYG
ncbi:MAG: ABC transporter permease [Rhodospirillales bacterium]